MIDFRRRHAAVHRPRFFEGKVNNRGLADVSWHGCQLLHPGWDDPNARALALTLAGFGAEADIHVMLNMDAAGLDFEVPVVKGRSWFLAVDTGQPSPEDIADPGRKRRLPPIESTSRAVAWSYCWRDRTVRCRGAEKAHGSRPGTYRLSLKLRSGKKGAWEEDELVFAVTEKSAKPAAPVRLESRRF